ncbi:MAG: hypothetical protein COB19_06425 [Porticoccus sp.]|nr:MAG: hypothetical protein COB19_06425 [Porticoccus sp.]
MKNIALLKNLVAPLFAGLFTLPIAAAPLIDLYEALVPVADQSDAARERALKVGLEKVLIKVTGDSQVLLNTQLDGATAEARRYVTAYSYRSYRDPLAAPTEDVAATREGMAINIRYSEAAIDQLLRHYQLQIWPAERPLLLAWIVVDDPAAGKQFVTGEQLPNADAALSQLMSDRGVPLLRPMFDLSDSQMLSEEQAWAFDQARLTAVADRYDVDSWLILRAYRSATGQWRGAWLLNVEGEDSLHSLTADSLPKLIAGMVTAAADKLASRYAYVPQDVARELVIQLDNINDYRAYREVTGFIESLEPVRTLAVDYVDADRVGLRVSVEGEAALLLGMLRRDGRITERLSDRPEHYRFSWRQP